MIFTKPLLFIIGILLLSSAVLGVKIKRQNQQIDGYKIAVSKFEDVQATNMDTIDRLKKANDAWAEQFELKKVAADQAVARVQALSDDLTAQNAKNRDLRYELARKNAAVDAYLRTGMPSALACQLWPQNCKK